MITQEEPERRKLQRETGKMFSSKILEKSLNLDNYETKNYKTQLISRFKKLFCKNSLLGYKNDV